MSNRKSIGIIVEIEEGCEITSYNSSGNKVQLAIMCTVSSDVLIVFTLCLICICLHKTARFTCGDLP